MRSRDLVGWFAAAVMLLLAGCSGSVTLDGADVRDGANTAATVPTVASDVAASVEESTSVPTPDAVSGPALVSEAATPVAWVQMGFAIEGEADGDGSGEAVAMSADGSRVAISAAGNGRTDDGWPSGHVRVFDWDGSDWVQVGRDIDGEADGDQSGEAMAMSADGSRLAIGARASDENGSPTGHVRVFDWDGSDWVQVGADIDGETGRDQSGRAVAMSADGSRVAIGAPRNDGNRDFSGHVRVFDWDGSSWVQLGVDIDGEAAKDGFGEAVALSADGSRLAVGATASFGADWPGHVQVFDWDGTTWVQAGPAIVGREPGDFAGAGVDLSADGSRVAIGVPRNDSNGDSSGYVQVLDWDGSSWIQVDVDIVGRAPRDFSGGSVALSADGSRVAIGARGERGADATGGAGHVRVLEATAASDAAAPVENEVTPAPEPVVESEPASGLWVLVGADIDGEASSDRSGRSVALSADGSLVAVGAASNNGNNGALSGHARVFHWDGSDWVQVGADIDGEAAGDGSGFSVALSADGSRVAVGAPFSGDDAGQVRVFDWDGSDWVQVGADIDGEAAGDGSAFSGLSVALSADGSRIVVGALNNGGNGSGSGHVRVFDWDGTSWVQVGVDIDGEEGDGSGWSVAVSADGARVAIGAPAHDGLYGIYDFSGLVRVFDWDGSGWVQVGAGIESEIREGLSGSSLALSADGSRIVVGTAGGDSQGFSEFGGQARVFDWDGSDWVQVGVAIDGESAGDFSGAAVALSADGSRVAVGAPANGGNRAASGHVRVLEQPA